MVGNTDIICGGQKIPHICELVFRFSTDVASSAILFVLTVDVRYSVLPSSDSEGQIGTLCM